MLMVSVKEVKKKAKFGDPTSFHFAKRNNQEGPLLNFGFGDPQRTF